LRWIAEDDDEAVDGDGGGGSMYTFRAVYGLFGGGIVCGSGGGRKCGRWNNDCDIDVIIL